MYDDDIYLEFQNKDAQNMLS